MKNNSSSKKTSYITRGAMILLTTILIILFFCIMLLVSQIQGTARIVNYAGLVRGKTQRIIKLEDAGQPHDEMIDSVSSYIKGLRYGSDKLNLVRLEDRAFQSKMQELNKSSVSVKLGMKIQQLSIRASIFFRYAMRLQV